MIREARYLVMNVIGKEREIEKMGKIDISSLSIREKVLQTVIIRVTNGNFNPAKVGGVFFGGTIISSPDERGVEGARALIKK